MAKTLNFDLFMQENEKRTIDVTVFGDVYPVSMEIPAIVPIMMARAEESMNPKDSTNMIMRAADAMFGSEAVNKMCRKGMTAANLVKLVERLFAEINGTITDDDDTQELTDEDSRVQTNSGKRAKK